MNRIMSTLCSIFIFSGFFLHLVSAQTGSWINKSPMTIRRSDHAASTVGNQIIVTGGCVEDEYCPSDAQFCFCPNITASVEAYQPLTDQWVTLSPLPRPRYRHAAVVVGQRVFVLGGRDVDDNIIQTVEVYDSLKGNWQTVANANWVNASSDLGAVSIGTKIYAIGGYSQEYNVLKSVWVFDTLLLSWSLHPATLNIQRGDACAVARDNTIYILGGFSDNFCAPLDTLEVFTTATNNWVLQSKLHNPRADLACGILHSEFHAIGGERKSSTTSCTIFDVPIRDVEHYHLASNTWTEETPLNEDRFRFAGATYGNTFYIFGGQGALVNSSSLNYPVLDIVQAWVDTNVEPENAADDTHLFIHLGLIAIVVLQVL